MGSGDVARVDDLIDEGWGFYADAPGVAEECFEEAIYHEDINVGQRVEAVYGLASSAFLRGKMDAASRPFDEVLSLDPTHALALADRGQLHGRGGNIDAALSDLRRAVELDPTNGESGHSFGTANQLAGDHELARRALRRATQLVPNSAGAWYSLAQTYLEQRNLLEALGAASKAIDLEEKRAANYLLRARISRALGKPEAAAAHERLAASLASQQ